MAYKKILFVVCTVLMDKCQFVSGDKMIKPRPRRVQQFAGGGEEQNAPYDAKTRSLAAEKESKTPAQEILKYETASEETDGGLVDEDFGGMVVIEGGEYATTTAKPYKPSSDTSGTSGSGSQSTGTSGTTKTKSSRDTSKSKKSIDSIDPPIPDEPHMNDDCECENYLFDPIFYLMERYGMRFPSWCCIFAALARARKGHTAIKYEVHEYWDGSETEASSQVPMDTLAEIASVIIGNGMKALNVTTVEELVEDYKENVPENEVVEGDWAEYGYGGCKFDFLTCKLVYAVYHALEQGANACYCHYRSTVMCTCKDCQHPNYDIDEKVSYFFGTLPKQHRRELEVEKAGGEEGNKHQEDQEETMETGSAAEDQHIGDLDSNRELWLEGIKGGSDQYADSLIKTCTQCPDHDGGQPYEKCYGYCLILATYPFLSQCFPDGYHYTY